MKTLSQNTQKLVNIYNLDFGEWGVAENIIVMVLGYDVFCVSLKSTVYKLVIVRIGCDKAQMIIHLNHLGVWEIEKGLNNVGCNLGANLLGKDFFVFSQNLIGYAKIVFPFYEISPDGIVLAATRKRHQQTICIKNDVHHCLYGVRMCSFFHSSMMVSLILPSSQRRSMASSACLAKYCPSKRRMSFISSSDLTLEISSSISIWNGVNGDDCKVDASIFNLLLYFVWVQMYDKYAKFANK